MLVGISSWYLIDIVHVIGVFWSAPGTGEAWIWTYRIRTQTAFHLGPDLGLPWPHLIWAQRKTKKTNECRMLLKPFPCSFHISCLHEIFLNKHGGNSYPSATITIIASRLEQGSPKLHLIFSPRLSWPQQWGRRRKSTVTVQICTV